MSAAQCFVAWLGQPPSSSSRQRFRLFPRVAAVESEVSARAKALARRSKPLSQVLPRRSRKYAVADDPLYPSSHPVNPSFAPLAGAKAVGSKRWGSITFSEMERFVSLSCVCSCCVCGSCAAGRCAGSFRCLKQCCQG